MRLERKRLPALPTAALSLLEIMVVVLIMGMIAGIVTKIVVDKVEQARIATAKVTIAELRDALGLFCIDNAFYPETLRGLVTKPGTGNIRNWPPNGYMPSIPLDPWGREYIYISPGVEHDFEIICLGRDGVEGGEGFDADINSWALSESAGAN